MLDHLGCQRTFLGKSHLGRERGVGAPLGRRAGGRLLQHAIDLFQREALGFRDQQVGVDETESAERAPDEEHFLAQVGSVLAHHVRGDNGDDTIPQPIRGGGQANSTGADGEREDLSNHDPSSRAPGGSEEENVDADEGNFGSHGTLVLAVGDADNGDNELTDQHAESAPDQKWSPTKLFNGPKGDGSRADVDQGGNQPNQEGVVNGPKIREKAGAEIEDEVDTRPSKVRLVRTNQGLKMETYCCIICMEVPRMVRRRLLLGLNSDPLKQLAQLLK